MGEERGRCRRRVVIATRLFAPEPAAAAYRQAALADALNRAGAEVEVLTTRLPHGVAGAQGHDAVRVRRWPVLRDAGGNVRGYLQYASFDLPLAVRLLVTRRPAAVVVEPPPTTGSVVRVVSWLRRVPYVYYASDVLWVAARGIGVPPAAVRLLRAVETWVLSGAEMVLTVSEGVRRHALDMGIDAERVVLVGTGVDTDVFTRSGPAESFATPTFVYAGTASEIQGASVFLEALGHLRRSGNSARLVFFGQGVETAALRARAEAVAPGGVEFRGLRPGDEVAAALRGAVAGLASVRPGRGYDFAYSTKALATLSCGAPVIYAGPGPIADLVRGLRLGAAVPWDVTAVVGAMQAALREPWTVVDARRAEQTVGDHHSLAKAADVAADRLLGLLGDGRE